MATLEKKIVDEKLMADIRMSDMELTRTMCEKNDYAGLPAYVIYDGMRIVAIAIVDPDGYPLYSKVCSLEVSPDYRLNGYGRWLLMEIAREYDDVKLVAMREVFDFYRKCGFVFDGTHGPEPDARTSLMVGRI